MKFYNEDDPAPNPRKVRIFLAEKGIEIPRVHVKIMKREHKAPEYMRKNPLGQVPMLELDDGTCISESIAICRYLEELNPSPALFGRTPLERANIEMWIRRAEFRLWTPMGQVWINDDPRTAAVNPNQFKDYGAHSRHVVANAMKWFDVQLADGQLSDGRAYLAGKDYSMADIVLLCGIDFAKFVNMDMPEEAKHLKAWHARVSARPSASAN